MKNGMRSERKIGALYKRGSIKTNQYRHAGTDLSMHSDSVYGQTLVVDQQYYIGALQDVQIDPQRSQGHLEMTAKEVTECRASLGAVQWVAVQTQPLALCSLQSFAD